MKLSAWNHLLRFTVCSVLMHVGLPLSAQNNLGTPNFSTIEPHQYDSINLQNLNISINIPVRSKSAGMPISYSLSSNNSLYPGAAGWFGGFHVGLKGALESPDLFYIRSTSHTDVCPDNSPTLIKDHFSIVDQHGTNHPVNSALLVDSRGCIASGFSNAPAVDQAGLSLNVTSFSGNFLVTDRSGNTANGTTFTDPNGNTITSVPGGSITDMLGATVITNSPSNVYSYTDAAGATQLTQPPKTVPV